MNGASRRARRCCTRCLIESCIGYPSSSSGSTHSTSRDSELVLRSPPTGRAANTSEHSLPHLVVACVVHAVAGVRAHADEPLDLALDPRLLERLAHASL